VKERLGKTFDTTLFLAAHAALIHGCSFLMWNLDRADFFKLTEFVPLYDEENGRLKAGFRFWSLDWGNRPVTVVVYEPEGYTKYRTKPGSRGLDLMEIEPLRGYVANFEHTEADGDVLTGYTNYSDIPIVPLWGNKHHQSDLVGMRGKIDVYDLVNSGFADTVQDCAEIYWIIGNAMGMSDAELAKFRDRLKLQHIAVADTDNSPVTPHTQEIPVTANETLLNRTRSQIYEDYGALDVHTVAAGATNDHIDAAYQSMDDEADDFEYQIIQAVQGILRLLDIKDTPIFHRNKVSNMKEQTETVMLAADKLDEETLLKKLPFLTPDEVMEVMARKQAEMAETVKMMQEV
jgi:SPP1 family phage portal protein